MIRYYVYNIYISLLIIYVYVSTTYCYAWVPQLLFLRCELVVHTLVSTSKNWAKYLVSSRKGVTNVVLPS